MKTELFNADETPFNLAGETLDNGLTQEGEARVRALAAREARKAQRSFLVIYDPTLIYEAREYCSRIRNPRKKAYAEAYMTSLIRNEERPKDPAFSELSYMGAQSVRMRLADILKTD